MRMRSAAVVGTLAAIAVGVAGCPSDQCPLETPQVSATPGTCIEVAGQPVSYQLRLCPTCNQTGATCVADLSAARATSCPAPPQTCGDIFLDAKVEACTDTTSCGGTACQTNPIACNFTAPSAPGLYNVITTDGFTGEPITRELEVIPSGSGSESCALAVAGP